MINTGNFLSSFKSEEELTQFIKGHVYSVDYILTSVEGGKSFEDAIHDLVSVTDILITTVCDENEFNVEL